MKRADESEVKPVAIHDWRDLVYGLREAIAARMLERGITGLRAQSAARVIAKNWSGDTSRDSARRSNLIGSGVNRAGRPWSCKGAWTEYNQSGRVYRCICGTRNLNGKCERVKYYGE